MQTEENENKVFYKNKLQQQTTISFSSLTATEYCNLRKQDLFLNSLVKGLISHRIYRIQEKDSMMNEIIIIT